MKTYIEEFKALAHKEIDSFTIPKSELELLFAPTTINPTGTGGRLEITGANTPLRQMNPFRNVVNKETTGDSEVGWVMKSGNAITGASNPWSAVPQPNAGTPNITSNYWKLPIQNIATYVSVRSLFFDDVTGFEQFGVVKDLVQELEQLAATSMVLNNDRGVIITATGVANPVAQPTLNGFTIDFTVASSTGFNSGDLVLVQGNTNNAINIVARIQATNATTVQVFYPTNPGNPAGGTTVLQDAVFSNVNGGSFGLRGLNSYLDGTTASFGTSGVLPNAGVHTIDTVTTAAVGVISYNDLTALWSQLDGAYLQNPRCEWHMHPLTQQLLRQLVDSQQQSRFIEVGDDDGGAVMYMFGHKVVPNSYIQQSATGNYPIYFGDWAEALSIVDHINGLRIYNVEQNTPGTTQVYGEIRLASSVKNPFALTRLKVQ